MVETNTAPLGTAFTVPVDHRTAKTGITAQERATTIRALVDPRSTASDFVRPGHLFPLVAKEGGVLRRAGHTEAAVDLARLAGLAPAGVLCEILDAYGNRADRDGAIRPGAAASFGDHLDRRADPLPTPQREAGLSVERAGPACRRVMASST